MAKLSDEFLEEGRQFIRDEDIDVGLMDWIDRSKVRIDKKIVRETLVKFLKTGRTDNAIKIFNAGFEKADPVADNLRLLIGLVVIGLGGLIALTLIGGAIAAIVLVFR